MCDLRFGASQIDSVHSANYQLVGSGRFGTIDHENVDRGSLWLKSESELLSQRRKDRGLGFLWRDR